MHTHAHKPFIAYYKLALTHTHTHNAHRSGALLVVFFVSAVFHELVLGVPLHLVRLWAFLGIMLQVPLVLITEHIHKRLKRDEAGNIVFWLTFCVVGQPLSVLLYYHDYLYEVRQERRLL